jgi:hypothetical protein
MLRPTKLRVIAKSHYRLIHAITSSPHDFTSSSSRQAGVSSRTITAPIERIKMLIQTGRGEGSVVATAAKCVREQGWRSLWRGNLANCVKVGRWHNTHLLPLNGLPDASPES